MCEELILWFGFRKTDDALAVFELAAFAEEFHAFETFQDTAAGGDAALTFEAWMLAHKLENGGLFWREMFRNAIAFFGKIRIRC